MNFKRVFLGGLVAGILINLSEAVLNMPVMGERFSLLMSDLELSEPELTLLLRLLDGALGDMRVEVRRTRTPVFHDRLKEDEKLLEGLVQRLRS